MVTCARTRGSGMMVLPVAAATASMTWPISASLKLGVMRWPLVLPLLLPVLWALTMPVAAKANMAAISVTRKDFGVIALSTFGPELELIVDLYIFLILVRSGLFIPGDRLGRLLHRDIAISGPAEAF